MGEGGGGGGYALKLLERLVCRSLVRFVDLLEDFYVHVDHYMSM